MFTRDVDSDYFSEERKTSRVSKIELKAAFLIAASWKSTLEMAGSVLKKNIISF